MAKSVSKNSAIIFRTIYVTLGVMGFLSCIGFFEQNYYDRWYIFYTQLSNIICIGVMFISLVAGATGRGYVLQRFRFYCLIMIMVTFFVYNILLSGDRTLYTYFTDIDCALYHCILPIMFFIDWVLFTPRRCLRWYDPLLCTVMPLIYVAFIVVRGKVFGATDYPYFFLDLDKLGAGGFAMWVSALVGIFVLAGFLLYGFDRIKLKKR